MPYEPVLVPRVGTLISSLLSTLNLCSACLFVCALLLLILRTKGGKKLLELLKLAKEFVVLEFDEILTGLGEIGG